MDEGRVTEASIDRGASSDGLSGREVTVFDAIAEKSGVLAETYRRIVIMARSDAAGGPVALVLVAHLCRELMNSLPAEFDVPKDERVEYPEAIDALSKAWPAGADGSRGDVAADALGVIARLVDDHARSRNRVGLVDQMILRRDPAKAGYTGPTEPALWSDVHRRAQSRTHFPRPALSRDESGAVALGLANDLTDLLFGLLAPFIDTTDAIDEILEEKSPTPSDARRVSALLATPTQAGHFFARADPAWLPVLLKAKKFFDAPPDVVPAGEGFYRIPWWPAGEFLERVAPRYPELAITAAWTASARGNHRVLRSIVGVLNVIPTDLAARTLARAPTWPSDGQVATWNTEEFLSLGLRLIEGGEAAAGFKVLRNMLRALSRNQMDTMSDYEVELTLKRLGARLLPDDAVRYVDFLRAAASDALGREPARSGNSLRWMRRFDKESRYPDREHPWRLFRAWYVACLELPDGDLASTVRSLVRSRSEVISRLGVAVLATRPAAAPDLVREVLGHPEKWFDGPRQREFCDLLVAAFDGLDTGTRLVIIDHAAAAKAADEWHARATEQGWPSVSLDAMRAHWQSEMLGRVAASLTDDEQARLSPSFPTEVDPDAGEVVVRHTTPESSVSAAEIAEMGPRGFADYYRSSPSAASSDAPYSVGEALRAAVAVKPDAWVARLDAMAEMHPYLVRQAVEGFRGALTAGLDLRWPATLDAIERALAGVPETDWKHGAAIAVCELLGDGLKGTDPKLTADAYPAAVRLAETFLGSPDPTPEDDRRSRASSLIAFAVGTVRGEAVVALGWLLYRMKGLPGHADLERALLGALAFEQSPSVWTYVGHALPLLLDGGLSDPKGWAEALLGPDADEATADLVWNGYIIAWNALRPVAETIPYRYGLSAGREARAADGERGQEVRTQLGSHLVGYVVGGHMPQAHEWIASFYENSADPVAARTSRFLADCLAEPIPEEGQARVVALLRERVACASQAEARSIAWAARSAYSPREVYQQVVLPALVKGKGSEDNTGTMGAIVSFGVDFPEQTAEALSVMVEADDYGRLALYHGDELHAVLAILLGSAEPNARKTATAIVHGLAARRFDRFAVLLRPKVQPDDGGPAYQV